MEPRHLIKDFSISNTFSTEDLVEKFLSFKKIQDE